MELSELIAYAKRKYKIDEQHKWSDFPGFSVLCHPETGKWITLLMRQWDTETGNEIERCDIKCGPDSVSERRKTYLTAPVRMRGRNWIGIIFEEATEPEVIYHLFDRAVSSGNPGGATIVLNETQGITAGIYGDTPLPFADIVTKVTTKNNTVKKQKSTVQDVPEKLRDMIYLYEYGDGSLANKARNFYRQGKYMEDYEDDAPWSGEYQRYFTTYHDLNVRQLRGYFTWRTSVRKGEYRPIAISLAYMYLYELLCGIGVDSPEDTLCKIRTFEEKYLDAGFGDQGMRRNLRKWCLEYAVLHDFSREMVLQYVDPLVLEKDSALAVLKKPKDHTEHEVFSALSFFAGKKLKASPVLKKNQSKGEHLFSELWRYLSEHYKADGRSIFTICFGRLQSYRWYPLSNAVYYEDLHQKDREFILNECRSYQLRNGIWKEKQYGQLNFNKEKFSAIIHGSDRYFRRYLKTGNYIKVRQEEDWVTPYVEAVLREDRRADTGATQPEVDIDFSGLERIRLDSIVTRDSLLTEEEIINDEDSTVKVTEATVDYEMSVSEMSSGNISTGLDALHFQILSDLLAGRSAERRINDERLMPSVVTDTINEALFEEIGDNILECDGNQISLVEDYREDIIQALGGHGG